MLDSIWQFSRRWAYTLRLGLGLRSFAWAARLIRAGLTGGNFRVAPDGKLFLGELNISIAPGSQEFFLTAYSQALAAYSAGIRFRCEDGKFVAEIDGVRVAVETFDDLFILNEIYGEGAYAVDAAGQLLIFDVGMNVGHASLYFASRFPQAVIYGYEPFTPTFDRARHNFELNPALAERIHPCNFGLATGDGTLEVEFDPVLPGRMGIFGVPSDLATSSGRQREQVKLKDVVPIFDQTLAAHPNRTIVLKIDCEGAEYDILQRLHDQGRLREVHVLALEWHRKAEAHDPRNLAAMLSDAGFTLISHGAFTGSAGMMYGVNAAAFARREALLAV